MKKSWVIIPLIGGLGLLYAVFSHSDFRWMSSQMARDSQVASSGVGQEEAALGSSSTRTIFCIENGGSFGSSLQVEMVRQLETVPAFGQIVECSTPLEQAGYPLLNIEVIKRNIQWTPIFARAELDIEVAYASNGDLSFKQTNPPYFRSQDGHPSIQLIGNFGFADVSKGLFSSPGYHRYLSQEVAKTLLERIQEQLKKSYRILPGR